VLTTSRDAKHNPVVSLAATTTAHYLPSRLFQVFNVP